MTNLFSTSLIRNIYKKRFNDIATAIQTEMGAPNSLARGSQATVGLSHLKTAIRVLENHKFEFKHGSYFIRHEFLPWPNYQVIEKKAFFYVKACRSRVKQSQKKTNKM